MPWPAGSPRRSSHAGRWASACPSARGFVASFATWPTICCSIHGRASAESSGRPGSRGSCAPTMPGAGIARPGSGPCFASSSGCGAGSTSAPAPSRRPPDVCGIAGFAFTAHTHPVDRELLLRMTTIMRHRGPDADGFHVGPGVGLGHRRLSIIDVAGGDQPIYGEDRSSVVILNGEIYNFQELQRELAARGHVFTTRSDTESIVHAYEEWGLDCVTRLRGMLAFVIWDEKRRRPVPARGLAGKEPPRHHAHWERPDLPSEVKGLLQDTRVQPRPSAESLSDYLSFRNSPGPPTVFQDIPQVPPAHFLVWERG